MALNRLAFREDESLYQPAGPDGRGEGASYGAGFNTGYAGGPIPGQLGSGVAPFGGAAGAAAEVVDRGGGGGGGGGLVSVEESDGAFDWLLGGTETRTPEWRPSDVGFYDPYRAAGQDVQYIRGQQLQGLGDLQAAAQGLQPSVAEMQMRRGLGQAQRGQMALASSARGGAGNQLAAQRQASIQGTRLAGDVLGQAGEVRAGEMERARQGQMVALGQMRAQDWAAQEAAAREWARQQQLMFGLTSLEMGAPQTQTPGLLDIATGAAAALVPWAQPGMPLGSSPTPAG